MPDSRLHRLLRRQLLRHVNPETRDLLDFRRFVQAVDTSYHNFDRDKDLFEQSLQLNDREYNAIMDKLRAELAERKRFQQKLVDTILRLNQSTYHTLQASHSLEDLIAILDEQIKQKDHIQRELVQAKIVAENANAAKTDFLSMMSHEIRTPLNAVIGLTYIMEQEDSLESYREHIRSLQLSAHNLHLLINDVLDFNKIETGKLELEQSPFDLRQLLEDTQKTQTIRARENNNQLILQMDSSETPPVLIGDTLRLGQVLTNLVSNALKFTQSGVVTLRYEHIQTDEKYSRFRISVKDTGIGIAAEKLKLIFEKFTQADSQVSRKYGGSGLGLLITKRILQLWNSDIYVESTLGQGSLFYFELKLPLADSESLFPPETLKRQDPFSSGLYESQIQGLRILLAEDNALNITIAKKILQRWGCIVDAAVDGKMVVEMCQKSKYDLILMDIQMPIMDGYEATRRIRDFNPTIPIVALTASAMIDGEFRARECGMNDFITKPIHPNELFHKIQKNATLR